MAELRAYETAQEVLDRTRELFTQANWYLRRGVEDPDWTNDGALTRAAQVAQVAAAGASLAAALLAQEDVTLAEEVGQHLGPYPTPLGRPDQRIIDALRGRDRDGR